MSTLKKIKNSLQDGSFSNKVKRKCLKLVIKNGNTRNKLLQDMALRELQRDYGAKLKELVESYEAAPMEYSNKVWKRTAIDKGLLRFSKTKLDKSRYCFFVRGKLT